MFDGRLRLADISHAHGAKARLDSVHGKEGVAGSSPALGLSC